MILQQETEIKKELSLREPRSVYLLCSDEPALLAAYRKKLMARLCEDGSQPDCFDGKRPDFSAIFDALSMLSLIGGRRIVEVSGLEPEQLLKDDCEGLLALIKETSEDATLLLVTEPGSVDQKKGKNAKKLLAAVDKVGVAFCINRRTPSELRQTLRAHCQKRNCNLSPELAGELIERCGDDLFTLQNECDKLCALAGDKGEITKAMIASVSTSAVSADLYAVAKLMLKKRLQPVLDEINGLLSLRQPVPLILANLGGAFADLSRALAARSAGKTASDLTADFAYRFPWRAQNAYRDCQGLHARQLEEICSILCQAEEMLKSVSCDERVLLETAIVRSVQVLQGVSC